MEIGEVVWLGIGIAAVAVTAALVPALLEVRRAARSLDRTLDGVQGRLPGLLERVDDLLGETTGLLRDVQGRLDRLEQATSGLRHDLTVPLARAAAAVAGLREAAQVLLGARPPRDASTPLGGGRPRGGPGQVPRPAVPDEVPEQPGRRV